MSISFVQAIALAGPPATQTATLAFSSNNTLGNLLIMAGVIADSGAGITVSDSQSNTWLILPSLTGTGGQNLWIAYSLSCKAGANTVTVHNNTNSTTILFDLAEFNPGAGSAFTNTDGTNTVPGTTAITAHTTITTTNPNDAIITISLTGDIVNNVSGTLLPANWAGSVVGQYQIVTSVGTYNQSVTQNSSNFIAILSAAFAATSIAKAAPSVSIIPRMRGAGIV